MVFPNDTVLTKVAEPFRNNTHFPSFTWAEGGWTNRYIGGACYDPGDHHPEVTKTRPTQSPQCDRLASGTC